MGTSERVPGCELDFDIKKSRSRFSAPSAKSKEVPPPAVGGEDGCGPTRLKVLAVCRLLCADSVAWVGRPRPPIVLSSTALRIPNGNLGRPSCPRGPPYSSKRSRSCFSTHKNLSKKTLDNHLKTNRGGDCAS